jgi:hypothetical protein
MSLSLYRNNPVFWLNGYSLAQETSSLIKKYLGTDFKSVPKFLNTHRKCEKTHSQWVVLRAQGSPFVRCGPGEPTRRGTTIHVPVIIEVIHPKQLLSLVSPLSQRENAHHEERAQSQDQ